jgi:hypothetical protein
MKKTRNEREDILADTPKIQRIIRNYYVWLDAPIK